MSNGGLFRNDFVRGLIEKARRRRTLSPSTAGKVQTIETRAFETVGINEKVVDDIAREVSEGELVFDLRRNSMFDRFDPTQMVGLFNLEHGTVSFTTTVVRYLRNDPRRFFLRWETNNAGDFFVAVHPIDSPNGEFAFQDQTPLEVKYADSGDLVTRNWFGRHASGAGGATFHAVSFHPRVT